MDKVEKIDTTINSEDADLEINIILNEDAYKYTNFGEAPQIAIWFEDSIQQQFKTVWVTHRAGNNDWKGKFESPVALSYWDSRKLFYNDKQVDVVTGATPKNSISIYSGKPGDGIWEFFVEVNASADFNNFFSYWSTNKMPDGESNGQPSIVYKGQIDFDSKQVGKIALFGRTKQIGIVTSLESDFQGITTAKNLIKEINVKLVK